MGEKKCPTPSQRKKKLDSGMQRNTYVYGLRILFRLHVFLQLVAVECPEFGWPF